MRKQHISYIVVILLSLINIANANNTSALSYSSNVNIGFTFNPTLSVSVSSSDLVISNLVPGSTLDSNTINVSVATNAPYGYTLSAMMNGSNSNLTHINNSINNANNVFSSISTDSSLPSLTTDNTWGYSYKLSNDTNWNNYSGLSTETSKTLVDSNDQTTTPIDFKIAAKAASTQASGTYTGTINFAAVTKPTPMTLTDAYASEGKTMINGFYTMQDMTNTICNKVEAIGAQLQVLDERDNKLYWISKLADGHCWMTQNLDLDIGGTNTAPLNSNNTDISTTASGSGIYNNTGGYTVDNNNVWTWTPANTAITANHTISGTSVSNWANNNIAPYSVEGGDVYYYTSNGSSNESVFNSLAECATNGRTEAECKHYHRGNYYNWTTAIATNNSSGISDNYANASNSICPKNWRLPVATNNNQSVYEFGDLLYTYYGITKAKYNTSDITSSVAYTNDGFVNIRKAPLWFVRSGGIYNYSLGVAITNGYYWSSTVVDNNTAYILFFNRDGAKPSNNSNRYNGVSVRCIAR